MEIYGLKPEGRKLWVKKQWDEYFGSRLNAVIARAVKQYSQPEDDDTTQLAKGKWKATIDRKVNYLLGRTPTCTEAQDEFNALAKLIRETATQLLLRGSLIWVVQGDEKTKTIVPGIMYNAIDVYDDEEKKNVVATIRHYVTISIDDTTGAESEVEMLECYYENEAGSMIRDTFCYANPALDKTEELGDTVKFIELGKTGTAPLYAYSEEILVAFDGTMIHQETTTKKNTKPLVEVRGYSGSDDDDLSYAVDELSIVKTDGNGGVTIHTRQMDSAAIDLWQKRLLNEWMEVTAVVGKENELQYAVSGKAMDRLFVDMENSAQELGHMIGDALKEYFAMLGKKVEIVWNTDKPTDDASTIAAIVQSRGIVSERTLLEQHPWVSDVDEEMKRLQEEQMGGMSDLLEPSQSTGKEEE